jgi:predicted kinase
MAGTATLHLISGLPCAGKSTYAERLKNERDAVHLALDRWLITCFGRYALDVVGYGEHLRRVHACRELIWSVAAELLRRNADVILDDGFFLRRDRRRYITLAHELGAGAAIHFVDTPAEVVRARLAARNREPGQYHFEIAAELLDGFVAFFEPPSKEEGADLIVVRDAVEPRGSQQGKERS